MWKHHDKNMMASYLLPLQPELIKKNGYPVESHQVVTQDGFILTLHRIPYGRHGDASGENRVQGRQPVFLQHGLLSSSACWLMAEPEKALGRNWHNYFSTLLCGGVFLRIPIACSIYDSCCVCVLCLHYKVHSKLITH